MKLAKKLLLSAIATCTFVAGTPSQEAHALQYASLLDEDDRASKIAAWKRRMQRHRQELERRHQARVHRQRVAYAAQQRYLRRRTFHNHSRANIASQLRRQQHARLARQQYLNHLNSQLRRYRVNRGGHGAEIR